LNPRPLDYEDKEAPFNPAQHLMRTASTAGDWRAGRLGPCGCHGQRLGQGRAGDRHVLMRMRRMTRDELAHWYLRAALPLGMPVSARGAAGWQGLRLVSGAVSDDRSVSCAWAGLALSHMLVIM
jgi:hypothetical protein